jgi:hypothetical protein
MGLEVIGAGFGRTGTESMKLALEHLGLGPCHHMHEVIGNKKQVEWWRAATGGDIGNWDEVFEGYRSAMDWPSAFYWRQLSEHYLSAKIILTLRSADSWYKSFSKTILPVLTEAASPSGVGPGLIGQRLFGGRGHDRGHAIRIYEENTASVQAAFPPDRLLTYHIGDGWVPLCEFLGCPVPQVDFPRSDTTGDVIRAVAEQRSRTTDRD